MKISTVTITLNSEKTIKQTIDSYLQQEYQVPECQAQKYDNIKTKIEIIHGWSDDIIPVEHSIKYAEQTQCTLHLIDGDHRLNSSLHQVIELFNVFLNVNKNCKQISPAERIL